MPHDRELALMFKALAAPARIRMIQLLKNRALCVGALAKILAITPSAVSQHLGVLKEAGLVVAEKRGYFMHYRLHQATLARWKEALEQFLTTPEASEPGDLLNLGGSPCAPVKPNVRNRKS
jgi:ArsR family transcriptional regulator, arsenate/arsenite/antimonite-responsive transcriptional repressor